MQGLQRQTRYTRREASAVTDLAYAFGLVPNGNLLPWLNNVGAFGSNIIPGLILAGDAVWAFGELWDGLTATTTSNAAAINADVSNLGVGIVNAMASASGQVAGYTQTMLGTITDFVADANTAWSNFWAGSTPANNSTSSVVGTVSAVVGAAADATSAAVSAAHTAWLQSRLDWSDPKARANATSSPVIEWLKKAEADINNWVKGAAGAVGDFFSKYWKEALAVAATVAIVAGVAASGGASAPTLALIPALATGTVVPPNNPYLAMLGDNKREPEIVSPLSTMKQAVSEVLASGNYGGAQTVIVQIDGREVARAVRDANGQMGTQSVYGGFTNAY
jgi:hypothetical protein